MQTTGASILIARQDFLNLHRLVRMLPTTQKLAWLPG